MAEARGRLAAYVLLVTPVGAPDAFAETSTWTRAREIPGVTALVDTGGDAARRFGAETSGQTVVYDAAGRLVFSGGITAARGVEGENAGRRRIASLVTAGAVAAPAAAVFGCPLHDPPEASVR
jgi:hypothetical protein